MQPSDLILYIAEHGSLSTQEAIERFAVSVRTVRSCVKKANESLAGFASVAYQRQLDAYALDISDEKSFGDWRRRAQAIAKGQESYAEPEGRMLFILSDLLFRDDWVTVSQYADALFVSSQSISADLKRAEKFMRTYGLQLVRKPHYGIRVSGSEISRRLCLEDVIASSDNAKAAAPTHDVPSGYLDKKLLDRITQILRDALRVDDLKIVPASFRSLVFQIAIAARRMDGGSCVSMETSALARIRVLPEYRTACRIACKLDEFCRMTVPQEEIAYIAIQLAGKRLGSVDDAGADDATATITGEAWEKVDRIFETIWQEFHFDFRDDVELRLNLGMHIAPLLIRLKYKMQLENPMIYDIKASFPLAYLMAHAASAVLTEDASTMLSEDEMGYIALAFALALDRKKGAPTKRRILALYSSSAGSARMFEHCLRRDFASYIETLDLRDVGELDMIDFSDYDCVFSTVEIPRNLGIPIMEVSPFFNESERRHIERFFTVWNAEQPAPLGFNPRLFYPHMNAATKDEAIVDICRRVRAVMDLPKEFEDCVRRRESLAPTAFGNLTALPHPAEAITDATFVAVGLLDSPVIWCGHEVRAVFLLSISRQAGAELEGFYTSMVRLLTSGPSIERLVREQRFEVLLEELQNTHEGEQE